jgi:hypothetical protein
MLIIDGACVAHILHRETVNQFATNRLIPKLHATAFACSLPGVYAKVHKVVRSIVEADLVNGFFPGVLPEGPARAHARAVADLTILRCRLVRARTEAEDYVPEDLKALADEFLELLDGDHRQPRLQHFCYKPSCCKGQNRAVCIERMSLLILKVFFAQLGVDLPAANRWYTFSPHLARQCGGLLCHSILPRVAKRAFIVDPASNDDDDDSYHGHANKQKQTSVDFLSDERAAIELLGVALLGVAPLDQLSHRLQHLDFHRGSLAELSDFSAKGVLRVSQVHLWQICNPWFDSERNRFLPALQWHLEARGSNADLVLNSVRSTCVGLAASVWSRLELKCPSSLLFSIDVTRFESFSSHVCNDHTHQL